MIVRNQQQALSVAVDMESRAIKTYERALMLSDQADVHAAINDILSDEREHLRRFMEMQGQLESSAAEDRMLTGALATEALFPGGVMEMKRAHALDSVRSVYEFAAESEQDAVEKYLDFALKCDNTDIREAFCAIAQEEASHLAELNEALEAMTDEGM